MSVTIIPLKSGWTLAVRCMEDTILWSEPEYGECGKKYYISLCYQPDSRYEIERDVYVRLTGNSHELPQNVSEQSIE